MSENLTLPPQDSVALQPDAAQTAIAETDLSLEQANTLEAFSGFLDTATGTLREVAVNRESINEAGNVLIEHFDIDKEFFTDPTRALLFTAIASRLAKVEDNLQERDFLGNSLVLLAHDHSGRLQEIYGLAKADSYELSGQQEQETYDKYTDWKITAELKEAIGQGLLQDVKDRLGITRDNEDPYEVRVLSMGDFMSTHGLTTAVTDYDALTGNREQKLRTAIEEWAQVAAVNDWKEGLERRMQEFNRARGLDPDLSSLGWVTEVGGKLTLCIASPTIEKILHRELTDAASYYGEDEVVNDKAFLEHEYVHTQGGINLAKNNIDFGIAIEELRAEFFSGNRHGYQDAKGFSGDFKLITGSSLVTYLQGQPKGGDRIAVYNEIAVSVGLDRLLEIAMVRPSAYEVAQSNPINSNISSYLGGFDGVSTRLIEDARASGKAQEIEDRVAKEAEWLTTRDLEFLPTYFSMRRQSYGLKIMTDKLEQKSQEILATKGKQLEPVST